MQTSDLSRAGRSYYVAVSAIIFTMRSQIERSRNERLRYSEIIFRSFSERSGMLYFSSVNRRRYSIDTPKYFDMEINISDGMLLPFSYILTLACVTFNSSASFSCDIPRERRSSYILFGLFFISITPLHYTKPGIIFL